MEHYRPIFSRRRNIMAAALKLLSQFAMRAYEDAVAQAVANTAGYHNIETGLRISSGQALLIMQVKFYIGAAIFVDLAAAADELQVGLFSGTDLADFNTGSQQKFGSICVLSCGVTTTTRVTSPLVLDFTTYPSGGILVPPSPLFFGIQTFGAAAPYTMAAEMWYIPVSIPAPQSIEMILPFIPADV
jgi:hypothetical protein